MKAIGLFHKGLLDLRSHQWKYRLDPYAGCSLGCVYCAARRLPSSPARGRSRPGLLEDLRQDLAGMKSRAITYLSPAVDPYQPLEATERTTRRALELFFEFGQPVVVLTKSPLILRDQDLLLALHGRGLVQVQFTVLSVIPDVTRRLEPCVAPPGERLAAARQLSDAGIPIHFHVSPYIPGLYREGQLEATVAAIADSGGRCVYTNPLGLTVTGEKAVYRAMGELNGDPGAGLQQFYPRRRWSETGIIDPWYDRLAGDMRHFGRVCAEQDLSFVCEFIPEFSSIQERDFSGGIFKSALPAVYQMTPYWEGREDGVGWEQFRQEWLARFPAVDEEFLGFVRRFWNQGVLFENTTLEPRREKGETVYRRGKALRVRSLPRPSRPLLWWRRLNQGIAELRNRVGASSQEGRT